MEGNTINGKKLAEKLRAEIKSDVLGLKERNIVPGLAVVLVGNDEASELYVHKKEEACKELGIESFIHKMPENTNEEELLSLISSLNNNNKVSGILVQLPLSKSINEEKVINLIDPKKDVDCFHPENFGLLMRNEPRFLPCTPAGIMELMSEYKISLEGKNVVIIGRSNIVGKPLAAMLMNYDATVTLCHSKTVNLKAECLRADILISSVGKTGIITADMVKEGAVVIDVGTRRSEDGKLLGDVDFKNVSKKASLITPVPGGVGPMTVTMLMKNVIKASQL